MVDLLTLECIRLATVGPSGQSIVVVLKDEQGRPINIQSLMPVDNVQSLTISAMPDGDEFVLLFDGQTTAPIPVTELSPLVYGLWIIPVIAGHTYQIANANPGFGWEPTSQCFETFDVNGTPIGSPVILDLTNNTSAFTDNSTNPDGGPTRWTSIGTFTPTATGNMTVRISAPIGQYIIADGLRIADTTASTVVYLDDQTPSAFFCVGWNQEANPSDYHWYNQSTSNANGSGIGPRYTADPAIIQSKLEALPNVGPDNVIVTASDSHGSGPYEIHFQKAMGGVTQPEITASDRAIGIATMTVGGVYPILERSNGETIPLKNPVWGAATATGIAPYLCYTGWMLPQSAPATQMIGGNWGQFSAKGNAGPVSSGYNLPSIGLFDSGALATYLFPHQPPGTYRLSLTWPVLDGLSSSVLIVVQDGENRVLATHTVDQTTTPRDFSADGAGWDTIDTLTLDSYTDIKLSLSVASGYAIADTVRLDRISPDTSVVIGPTETTKLILVDGWATDASGHPIAGGTFTLENRVDGSFLPDPPITPQKMGVGYNITGSAPNLFTPVHANLVRGMSFLDAYETDSHGYPTILAASSYHADVFSISFDYGGKGKGLAALPFGQYTVDWDGASPLELAPGSWPFGGPTSYPSVGTEASLVSSKLTGTTGNRRVYNLTPNAYHASLGPIFSLIIHGTTLDPSDSSGTRYLADVRNIRIYPPGVDPDNPPRFFPTFTDRLQGVKIIRFLDPLVTNGGNIADFSDYYTLDDAGYGGPKRTVTVPIAQINGYTGPGPIGFDTLKEVVLEVTTTVPHGLSPGQYGTIINSTGTVNASNESYSNTFSPGEHNSACQILSPTMFLMAMDQDGTAGHTNRVMTNTITGAACGQFQYQVGGGGWAFSDCAALCNQLKCAAYINVPVWATDDLVRKMAESLASGSDRLNPGQECWVEFSNECWNFGFLGYAVCCMNSILINGVPGGEAYWPWYVYRMKQVHDIFVSVFSAAGRLSDLIRVMGTQGGYSGITKYLIDYAVQYGAQFEKLVVAPYFDNASIASGGEPMLQSIYDTMTTDQIIDLCELNLLYGGLDTFISSHRPILDAAGYTSVGIACYEGGLQNVLPIPTSVDVQRRSHAVARHPRMRRFTTGMFQQFQAAGATDFIRYLFNGYAGPPAWGDCYGWDMQPGTGISTIDAINISDPEALDQIKSEPLGALLAWAALSSTGTKTMTPIIASPQSVQDELTNAATYGALMEELQTNYQITDTAILGAVASQQTISLQRAAQAVGQYATAKKMKVPPIVSFGGSVWGVGNDQNPPILESDAAVDASQIPSISAAPIPTPPPSPAPATS